MLRYLIKRTPEGPLVKLSRMAYLGSFVYPLFVLLVIFLAHSLAREVSGSTTWAWIAATLAVLVFVPWAQDLRWALGRIPRLILGGDEFLFDRLRGVVTKNELLQCKMDDIVKIAILMHSRITRVPRRFAGSSYLVGLLTPDGTFTMVDDTWDKTSAWNLQESLCSTLRIPAVYIDVEKEDIPVEQPSTSPQPSTSLEQAQAEQEAPRETST